MAKILIVDDDPTLVDFLKLLLDSEGYETLEASDGASALQQIAEDSPEVVLLDYMMPNMDGLDVLRNVSQNFESSFVVMLTGKGSEEVAVQCMKEGAIDYVIKPFDNDRLLAVVRNAIRYRESELEKRKITGELQKHYEQWNHKKEEIRLLLEQCSALLQSKQIDAVIPLLQRARDLLR